MRLWRQGPRVLALHRRINLPATRADINLIQIRIIISFREDNAEDISDTRTQKPTQNTKEE